MACPNFCPCAPNPGGVTAGDVPAPSQPTSYLPDGTPVYGEQYFGGQLPPPASPQGQGTLAWLNGELLKVPILGEIIAAIEGWNATVSGVQSLAAKVAGYVASLTGATPSAQDITNFFAMFELAGVVYLIVKVAHVL